MGKRWAETNLEFFPGSNMLVHLVASKTSLWSALPKMGLVNFCLFTSSRLVLNCTSSPYHVSLPTPKGHKPSPNFRLSYQEQGHPLPLASHMRTRSSDFLLSLVCFFFQTMVRALFGRSEVVWFFLFIYLFIVSLSLFYEPFNYVTHRWETDNH